MVWTGRYASHDVIYHANAALSPQPPINGQTIWNQCDGLPASAAIRYEHQRNIFLQTLDTQHDCKICPDPEKRPDERQLTTDLALRILYIVSSNAATTARRLYSRGRYTLNSAGFAPVNGGLVYEVHY